MVSSINRKKALWIPGLVVIVGLLLLGFFIGQVDATRNLGFVLAARGEPDVPVIYRPSFSQDILPIFKEYCATCHGVYEAHNGLRLDSYDGVMKGTQFGPVVVPGNPDLSNLLLLIKHESSPDIWMPFHKPQLSPNRIKNIENWIRIGAPNN